MHSPVDFEDTLPTPEYNMETLHQMDQKNNRYASDNLDMTLEVEDDKSNQVHHQANEPTTEVVAERDVFQNDFQNEFQREVQKVAQSKSISSINHPTPNTRKHKDVRFCDNEVMNQNNLKGPHNQSDNLSNENPTDTQMDAKLLTPTLQRLTKSSSPINTSNRQNIKTKITIETRKNTNQLRRSHSNSEIQPSPNKSNKHDDSIDESSSEYTHDYTDEDAYSDESSEVVDSDEDLVTRSRSVVLYHSTEQLKGELQRNFRNWYQCFKRYMHIPDELNAFQRRNIEGFKGSTLRKGDTQLVTQKGISQKSSEANTNIVDCMPTSNGYCLWIDKFENVLVPKNLLSDFSKYTLEYRVNLSLFHTGTHSFFGRTYKSPSTAPLKTVQKTGSFLKQSIKFDRPIFYHSRIYDSSVVVVAECIACIKSKGVVAREISVGWSILRVFGSEATLKAPELSKCLNTNRTSLRKGTKVHVDNVYKGTPRALLNIAEPLETPLVPHSGTKIVYHHFTYSRFKKGVSHLVEEDGFYSNDDSVPGIKNTSNKFLDPILLSTTTLQLYHLTINLPSTLERDLMHYLEETRSFEQGKQLDKERSIIILKRQLRFCYNNTCTYVKPYGLPTNVELHTTKTLEPSGYAVELELVGSIDLKRFIRNKDCALIMELIYEIGVPAPLQEKIKKEGGIFGIFARKKRLVVKNTEIDYKVKHVCVGQYLLLPFLDPIFKSHISCEMDVGPGRSITGNLIYAPRRHKEKVDRPHLNFSLRGMDLQESFRASWTTTSELPQSPAAKSIPSPKPTPKPKHRPESDVIMSPKQKIPKIDFAFTPLEKDQGQLDDLSARSANKDVRISVTHSIEASLDDLTHFIPLRDANDQLLMDTHAPGDIQHFTSPLAVDKVYIQILGFSPVPLSYQNVPTHFYFRLNFFNQPESCSINSPLEVLEKKISGLTCNVLGNISNSQYGLTFSFTMDPFHLSESEWKRYRMYLKDQLLIITIYDANTHLRFGVICIPLTLVRRSDDRVLYVQHTREYHIVESLEEAFSPANKDHDTKSVLLFGKGKLLVRVSNIGAMSKYTESQAVARQIKFEKSLDRDQKIIEAKSFRSESSLAAVLGGQNRKKLCDGNDDAILVQRALSLKLYKENEKEMLLEKTYTRTKITERKLIYAGFGVSEFFEIPFSNIGRTNSACTVKCSSQKVTLASIHTSNFSDSDYSIIKLESGLQELVVKPRRMAKVKFRFLELVDPSPHEEDVEINIMKNGSSVRVIHLKVVVSSPEIHQSLEVFASSMKSVTFILSYDRQLFGFGRSGEKVYTRATNNVIVDVRSIHQLLFSLERKPHMHESSFLAMIYSDAECNHLEQIWNIKVHHLREVPISGEIGQRVYFTDNIDSQIQQYLHENPNCENHKCLIATSRDLELQFEANESTPLKNLTTLKGSYFPRFYNEDVKEVTTVSNIIDLQNEKIISRFLYRISLKPPTPMRRFAEKIIIGNSLKRQLTFTNSTDKRRKFVVSSNYPHLVRFALTHFDLESGQQQAIYLRLDSKIAPGTYKIYLFVNFDNPDNSDGVLHESGFCSFLIQATYSSQ